MIEYRQNVRELVEQTAEASGEVAGAAVLLLVKLIAEHPHPTLSFSINDAVQYFNLDLQLFSSTLGVIEARLIRPIVKPKEQQDGDTGKYTTNHVPENVPQDSETVDLALDKEWIPENDEDEGEAPLSLPDYGPLLLEDDDT